MKTSLHILGCVIFYAFSISLIAQEREDKVLLSLDDIFSGEYEAKSVDPVHWLADGKSYVLTEPSESGNGKDIIRYDIETGKRTILVPSYRLSPPGESEPVDPDDWQWSYNDSKILFFTNKKPQVWGGSTGDYWVLDMNLWTWNMVGEEFPRQSLKAASFSPDGNKVSFIYNANIYFTDLTCFKTARLTDKQFERVYNGIVKGCNNSMISLRYNDLRYGHEGCCWSPDSRKIAYTQVDYTDVPDFYMINNTETLYPQILSFPYIKVGQKLPGFRVGVVEIANSETNWLSLPCDTVNDYLWQMEWTPSGNELFLQILNRRQDTMKVVVADVNKNLVSIIHRETDKAWVEPNDIHWIENGNKFIFYSETDGWHHAYLYSRTGQKLGLLTPGDFDVVITQGVDEEKGWLYYIASPDNPGQRYLWRAPLNLKGNPERVTPVGTDGTYKYRISPSFRYAIEEFSSINTPPVYNIISLTGHKTIRALEDNSELKEKLAELHMIPTEFFKVDIGDNTDLDAWCVKPPDFNPGKKYPLLFFVYGEPALQTVLDQWRGQQHIWHLMLAQKGYFIMSVDNRGTPSLRGRDWRKLIHGKLGILAPEDQAAAARTIIRNRPYIDKDKIGVYGHSGGGQMSLHLIFRFPDVYQVAMPSSFVSNQRFYHPGYQERFMGPLHEKFDDYRLGSPITWAHQLEGKLLIIHGTGDSNVHYQSFEALINELVAHKKQFSMMSYPNRNHGLREGENTQYHLYQLRTEFLKTQMPPTGINEINKD